MDCYEKPFKTLDELIEVMISRNILVDDNTKKHLYYDSHYSIINGYKNLFIARPRSRKNKNDDIYKKGTHFNEIYSLYNLDRELRSLFLKELMRAETFFKNVYFYEFYSEFGDKSSYLVRNNYNVKFTQLDKTIELLKSIIRDATDSKHPNAIKHCIKEYAYVPFWVLLRFLTFSNMYYLYKAAKPTIKARIASKISSVQTKSIFILASEIENFIDTFRDFRNICAHDNIFYDHTTISKRNPYYVYNKLEYFLSKNNYEEFTLSLKNVLSYYRNNTPFKITNANDILKIMGFPIDWDIK